MSQPPLYNRLILDRQAAKIERCHIKPHIRPYSVGSHTHDVVSLLIMAWQDMFGELPRAELLVAAQAHDKGEIVTGDIPSPVKDILGDRVHEVDRRVEFYLFGKIELTDIETEYLAAADRFELWLWCWDELSMGNTTVTDWMEGYEELWARVPLPPPFMILLKRVRESRGLGQVSRPRLNEIGGLS